MRSALAALGLGVGLLIAAAAPQGCRSVTPAQTGRADGNRGQVRLVLVGNLGGVLEPCGCTKDQLGGLDHLGAMLAQERAQSGASLLLALGSTLFARAASDPESAEQQRWKAETIAGSLAALGLGAWLPGETDWAPGRESLGFYAKLMRAPVLALGRSSPGAVPSVLVTLAGVKLGLVGFAGPEAQDARASPRSPKQQAEQAAAELGGELERLQQQGARVLVALVAMQRGAALRLAEALPNLQIMAVADPAGARELDDEAPPPTMVGATLVVGTANHGQSVVVVELSLRPETLADEGGGLVHLADAGGVAQAEEVASLSRRMRQLEARINDWEKGGRASAQDLAARRGELESLRRQRAGLEEQGRQTPAQDSFRYSLREVRDSAGAEPAVAARMLGYYRKVNEQNRKLFANRKPPEPHPGQPTFVGEKQCSTAECHQAAYNFCATRPHARAYESLVKQAKEYDLECVGCHVTGYEQPGGSTVTFNTELRGVQCEECHGAGSPHVAKPNEKGLTVLKQPPEACAERCHRPPHVAEFDPVAKMNLILGPNHAAR